MKKIAGKIAMILVLVMLANSFAGCTLIVAVANNSSTIPVFGTGWLIGAVLLDILTIMVIMKVAEAPNETGIYLASAEHNPLTNYYSIMERINSLPETERMALMEKLNLLTAEKLSYLISTVNSLPQTVITASIERLNALSETELSSVVRDFNALSGAELDALADEINSRTKTENVVSADNFIILPEQNIVSLKNDLQYFNMGMRLCFQY